MIILEGPDGAGKTTLLHTLVERFELPVAPRVVSKETEAMVDLKEWTEHNVARGWQATFYDRHRLISEPIYGSIMRKKFEPGFDDFSWLHIMNTMFYGHCRPLIIYCLPSFPTVLENLRGDPDNVKVFRRIRQIYSLYVAKAAQDAVLYQAMMYNYEVDDPSNVMDWIDFTLRTRDGSYEA